MALLSTDLGKAVRRSGLTCLGQAYSLSLPTSSKFSKYLVSDMGPAPLAWTELSCPSPCPESKRLDSMVPLDPRCSRFSSFRESLPKAVFWYKQSAPSQFPARPFLQQVGHVNGIFPRYFLKEVEQDVVEPFPLAVPSLLRRAC